MSLFVRNTCKSRGNRASCQLFNLKRSGKNYSYYTYNSSVI